MAVVVAEPAPLALEVVLRARPRQRSLDFQRMDTVVPRLQVVVLGTGVAMQEARAVRCRAGTVLALRFWVPAVAAAAITVVVPAASILQVTPVLAAAAQASLGELTLP